MRDLLTVTWQSVKGLGEDFVLFAALNVGWVILSILPLGVLWYLGGALPFLALGLAAILLLPLAAYSGAWCYVANQAVRGKAVGWATFWFGLRTYWAKGILVFLLGVVGLIAVLVNLYFYGQVVQGAWTPLVQAIWLLLGLYWLLVQVFWFPMILELESERVLHGLRSALLMGLVTPGFSLSLGMVIVLAVAVSLLLTVPAVVLLISFLMLLANHATRSRLAFAQGKRYDPGAAEEGTPGQTLR